MFSVKAWIPVCALSAVAVLATPSASAKCTVTLKFTNNDTHPITILGNDSQSRVNGGTWSKMSFQNVSIQPGDAGTASWTTNMRCAGSAKRDLRFKFQDNGDSNK